MSKNARLAAAKAVMRMDEGGYSNLVVDAALENCELDYSDKVFVTALLYGVTERLVTLDMLIEHFSNVKKLSPEVRAILRISLHQLLYMRVPERAVVNEAVKLTSAMKVKSAGGFVNGLLRTFIRNGIPENLKAFDTFRFSCSKDVLSLLKNSIGDEKTQHLLESSFGKPPVFVRVNTLKISRESFAEEMAKYCEGPVETGEIDNCYIYDERDVAKTDMFKNGFYHIQDMSSQMCALALGAGRGMKVLDCCAAPGGKSFTVAEEMQNAGEIISCDIRENRVKLIDDGAKRLGITIIKTVCNDAEKFNASFGTDFDRVLCDVPCSGLGVIRRKPEIKYKSASEIKELAKIQSGILETSSRYLKVGGMMIYSTCSVNKEENEDIVNAFLEKHENFETVPFSLTDDDIIEAGMTTILPEDYNSDGFFIAKMKRKV